MTWHATAGCLDWSLKIVCKFHTCLHVELLFALSFKQIAPDYANRTRACSYVETHKQKDIPGHIAPASSMWGVVKKWYQDLVWAALFVTPLEELVKQIQNGLDG